MGRTGFRQCFCELTFDKEPDRDSRNLLTRIIDRVAAGTPANKHGKITHIDVRSDDVELLTIKAVRALQSADVVLYDKAINNDVLELARREARHILAGSDAEDRLIALARRGNHVVRISARGSNFILSDMDKLQNRPENEFQVDFI